MTSFKRWISGMTIALMLLVSFLSPQVAFAAAYITLESFSGHATTIDVSGGGWTPGEPIRLYLRSTTETPVATVTAGEDSFFNAEVPIPANTKQGSVPIIAVGEWSKTEQRNSYYVVPFTPSVTVTGNSTPGSTLSITGEDFAPNEHVRFMMNGRDMRSATADAQGSFSQGEAIVPNMNAGTYIIQARGASSEAEATEFFYVGNFFPSITPSSYYLFPADTLNFSGSGFAPHETIEIFMNQQAASIGSLTTDSNGSFANAGNIAIPFTFQGPTVFQLYGLTSQAQTHVEVNIGTFNPQVTPNAHFFLPGDHITFSGEGFAPDERVTVKANDSQENFAEFTVNAEGSFANLGQGEIPFGWQNSSQTFHLTGELSSATTAVTVSVGQFNSLVEPSAHYLSAGETISFRGSTFAPHETIEVIEGVSGMLVAQITADMNGDFTDAGTFDIPLQWNGSSRSFHFVGMQSGTNADVFVTIANFTPALTPSTYYLLPAQTFTLSGSGFGPNETVEVRVDAETTSVQTDNTGTFTDAGPFTAPLRGESVDITATGMESNSVAHTSLTLGNLYPSITPNAWYIQSGSTLQFSGSGFAPQEQVIVGEGGNALATTIADATGAFNGVLVETGYGEDRSVTYTFTGEGSGAAAQASITLAALRPFAALDTYYALPGSSVMVTGEGFAAGETVTISLDSAQVQATVNDAGVLSPTPIQIPLRIQGATAHVTVTGIVSNATALTTVTLAPFNPQVTPNMWYAAPGSTLTFTGDGFAPGESVSVLFNGAEVGTTTATTQGSIDTQAAITAGANSALFTFTGDISGVPLTIPIALGTLMPGIQLSTYYDNGGAPLTVTGMGYASFETVRVSIAGQEIGTATTDATGNVSFTGTVPYLPAGDAVVEMRGLGSHATASANITIAPVYVSAWLGAYAGALGTAITFVGSNFIPGETIEITTDRTGSSTVHSFTADASGSFNDAGFIIPEDFTEGEITLTITGQYSHAPVRIVYYVTGV